MKLNLHPRLTVELINTLLMANADSLAARMKISAFKRGVNDIFSNQFGISGFSGTFLNESPSTNTSVQEDVAMLFCCEAPERFCEQRNFTQLSVREHIMTEFSFSLNPLHILFNCSVHKVILAVLYVVCPYLNLLRLK